MATAITAMAPSITSDHGSSSMRQQQTTYTFDSHQQDYHMKSATAAANANTRKHRRHHQRTHSDDGGDSGSLTYSAASSINSAGESTDSSFADIMKVLDMQDPSELGPLMKDKGMSPAEYHMHLQQQQANYPAHFHHKARSSQASVASSLQYSTDGESNFLHGTDLVSTITGQPSDSMANDGGSYNAESSETFDLSMFAPADPTDSIKKRKKEKKNRSRDSSSSSSAAVIASRSSPNHHHHGSSINSNKAVESMQSMSSVNTSKQGSTATIRHKNNASTTNKTKTTTASHPPIPRNTKSKKTVHHHSIEDDVCYAEWWMSCFPDAFKEMMPKR